MAKPPTNPPIYRFIHVNNLEVYLKRSYLPAPNYTPQDELNYATIHDNDIQKKRSQRPIPCGPGGVIHDYVPFYFGYLSPMMLKLKGGNVPGYNEGQEPLIYLVSSVQTIANSGKGFVFSDGHGIAAYTLWFDNTEDLQKVDWDIVCEKYWADDPNGDNDRQRRKQAEFLIHRQCEWNLIEYIAVIDKSVQKDVKMILSQYAKPMNKPVSIEPGWYY